MKRERRRPNPKTWMSQHRRSMHRSIEDLSRRPVATAMTLLVLGIALALPASLLSLLSLTQDIAGSWNHDVSLSLFLKQEVDDEKALMLSVKLEEDPRIEKAQLLTNADAMEEFRTYSGFGDVLEALSDNPLPHLVLITTVGEENVQLEELAASLRELPETDVVEYDQAWIERLETITLAATRLVEALAAGLAIAVILIIGNTIRLEILNRRDEIEITRLVGGTHAYIRRPFLYTGLGYGLFGGLIAWLLVSLLLILVHGPVTQLGELYDARFTLPPFDWKTLSILLFSGMLLGLTGAWLAVGRQLSEIRPEN